MLEIDPELWKKAKEIVDVAARVPPRRDVLALRQQENLGNPRSRDTRSTHPRPGSAALVSRGELTRIRPGGAVSRSCMAAAGWPFLLKISAMPSIFSSSPISHQKVIGYLTAS
jgi:hypothetical protein